MKRYNITALRLSSLGAFVAFPMMLGAFAALADTFPANIGGGDPACLISGTTVTACSNVRDNDSCKDDFIEDGDCPSIAFSTAGLSGPPNNFFVECKYYKKVKGDNGCEVEGELRTYRAACQQPDGTSCP